MGQRQTTNRLACQGHHPASWTSDSCLTWQSRFEAHPFLPIVIALLTILTPPYADARNDRFNIDRDEILVVGTGSDNILENDSRSTRVNRITVDGTNYAIAEGSFQEVTLSTGAVLTVFDDGQLTFDPTVDSVYSLLTDPSDSERFQFSYRYERSRGRDRSSRVNIIINGVAPQLPTVVDDGLFVGVADEPISISADSPLNLLANDENEDLDSLEITRVVIEAISYDVSGTEVITTATGVKLTISDNGAFTLDTSGSADFLALGPDEELAYDFTYFASNSIGESAEGARVSFEISGTAISLPVAVADSYIVSADSTLTVAASGVLSNDQNSLGDQLSVTTLTIDGAPAVIGSLLTLSSGAEIRLSADGSLFFDPTGAAIYQALAPGDASLTYTLAYAASNGDGESALPAVIQIEINAPEGDIVMLAADDSQIVLEGAGRIQIDALANDTGNTPIEITSVAGAGSSSDVNQGGALVPVSTSLETDGDFLYYEAWEDFNGVDTFTYTARDADGQESTATVTITVTAVNDAPDIVGGLTDTMIQGTMKTWDGRYASEGRPLNLAARVFDKDNTVFDGLGCDPEVEGCASMQTLYFRLFDPLNSDGDVQGALTADACGTGDFTYTATADFSGLVSFDFDACDTNACSGLAEECVRATFELTVTELQRPASEDFLSPDDKDSDLTQQPLEIGITAEPNVLVVTDDSGSMNWDFLTEEAVSEGVYRYNGRNHHLLWPDSSFAYSWERKLSIREEDLQNRNLWRVQSYDYNKIYYNPAIRYTPWPGLNNNGEPFADSNFTNAIVNAWRATGSRDLSRENIARYYVWVDKKISNPAFDPDNPDAGPPEFIADPACPSNQVDVLDGPSPLGNSACREGWLVTIESETGASEWTDPVDGDVTNIDYTLDGFSDGSDKYPKHPSRTDCAADNFCTLDEEKQNFANYYTYARSREYAAKLALGTSFSESASIRLGFSGLQSSSTKIPIQAINQSPTTGAKKNFLDAVYQIRSYGSTPLRRSLRGAGQYFKCDPSNNIIGASGVPGDGEVSNNFDGGCPIQAAPVGTCQSNTTILLTDGYWTGSSPNLAGDPDGDGLATLGSGASLFDGGAFKGTGTEGNTLADVAIAYYETDLHPTLDDDVPVKTLDRARADAEAAFPNDRMHQHMKTYVISFGQTPGVSVPTDITQATNWGDPIPSSNKQQRVDDTLHAAFNGRGRLFSSSNPAQLARDIEQVLLEVQEGQGAASAVSFSSDELQEDTSLFKGSYNISTNSGTFLAQRIDSDGNLIGDPLWEAEKLLDAADYTTRNVIVFNDVDHRGVSLELDNLSCSQKNSLLNQPIETCSFEPYANELTSKVNFFRGDVTNEKIVGDPDSSGDFRGRTSLLGDIVNASPSYVKAPNRRNRNGLTYPQGDNLYSNFVNDATVSVRPAMIYVGSNDGMLHGFDAETGQERLAFIPNEVLTGAFNNRLADLSSPNYQHQYYVDLTPVVEDIFVGPPIEADAIDNAGKTWHTVLMGGYNNGGKGYFALNITDSAQFAGAYTGNDLVFWEFTEEDDTYPLDSSGNAFVDGDSKLFNDYQTPGKPIKDLGYSTSAPVIVMSNILDDSGEREWMSFFGNGRNSTSGIAKLFGLIMDRGRDGVWCHPDSLLGNELSLREDCGSDDYDFIKISTGAGAQNINDVFVPNALGTPRAIDVDLNGSADYIYAGDTQGNLYRFDLCLADLDESDLPDTDPNWYGGGSGDCKAGKRIFTQWRVTTIFVAKSSLLETQPIVSQPLTVSHPTGNGFIVIFGTGSYSNSDDITDTSLQGIYGIWDRLTNEVIPRTALVSQNYTNRCALLGEGLDGASEDQSCARTLSSNDVSYTLPTDDDDGILGWYNELNVPNASDPAVVDFPGERAIRKLQIRGGLVFVNSVVPRQGGSCGSTTGGFGLAFCPITGGFDCRETNIFDLNNDGLFDGLDEFRIDGVDGRVAGTSFGSTTPSDAAFLGDLRFTQLSDGTLDVTKTNTKTSSAEGRRSWRRIRQ